MYAVLKSFGLKGLNGFPVEVEADISGGMPALSIVGLPDSAVRESGDRVHSALKNLGFKWPDRRITINLAPADVRKTGPVYDLPLLLAVLAASGQLEPPPKDTAFLGELALDGSLRPVSGVLPMALEAAAGGVRALYVPAENAAEAAEACGSEMQVYPAATARQVVDALRGVQPILPTMPVPFDPADAWNHVPDFADVCGQPLARRAMVLAAAGDTTMEQILAACERHGLMRPRSTERVQRLWKPEPMTLAAAHKTLKMPVSKPCFGVGFKEKPLPSGDLRTEALYDLILSCITGGMSPLYRRLYDGGLVNPGFGGEVLRVDGCCCILFTGESDAPDAVKQMLLDEIARIRAAGVDREIFTLCKNEKYGQLIENLENVEDSASQMADFALSGQTVAQQITMLAGLTAEDADAALQHILSTDRMAVMDILPDGTAPLAENEEEAE